MYNLSQFLKTERKKYKQTKSDQKNKTKVDILGTKFKIKTTILKSNKQT